MKAYVISRPGGPEVLELTDRPDPEPREGWVLIRIRAFGLNRSEHFTREGHSPSVGFPRILGIECVGEVVTAPGTDLAAGQSVAAMMGDMGRAYDGSYAEMTLVPRAHVFPLETSLDWATLAALPEMLQTTHGSLHTGLEVAAGLHLLIRGGTSSIGLAALELAKDLGLRVTTTTRSERKREQLAARGADEVLVDDGSIGEAHPARFDRVLELIGTKSLIDSLRATRPGGVVCMTGILGGEWTLPAFEPLVDIPNGVKLTSYGGGSSDITAEELSGYVAKVEAGRLQVPRGPVFAFDQVVEAHRVMDENRANGKMVVVVDS